jgi:hypothetical protein
LKFLWWINGLPSFEKILHTLYCSVMTSII